MTRRTFSQSRSGSVCGSLVAYQMAAKAFYHAHGPCIPCVHVYNVIERLDFRALRMMRLENLACIGQMNWVCYETLNLSLSRVSLNLPIAQICFWLWECLSLRFCILYSESRSSEWISTWISTWLWRGHTRTEQHQFNMFWSGTTFLGDVHSRWWTLLIVVGFDKCY